jgi:hypothetical protein
MQDVQTQMISTIALFIPLQNSRIECWKYNCNCLFTFNISLFLVSKVFSSLRDSYQNFCIHLSFPTWKYVPSCLFHKISVLWLNSSSLDRLHFFPHVEQRYLDRGWWHTCNLQLLHLITKVMFNNKKQLLCLNNLSLEIK